MRASAVSVALLMLVLGACAAKVPIDASGGAIVPSVVGSPSVVPTSSGHASPSAAPSTSCPGRSWPPYRLGSIPGLAASSRDRATIEITNRTDRTYYYRVAGWQPDQFETCRALGEEAVEEGPIAAGSTMRVMIGAFADRLEVPITVAFWTEPCREGCQRDAPIAAMVVARSPLEPAAS
ncbi:MAG: hypothetical protein AB1627_00530 [Chloroflexota bacterium]